MENVQKRIEMLWGTFETSLVERLIKDLDLGKINMVDNPKHIQALKDGKDPLEYLVMSCWEEDAKCHKHGADKYGERNWRIDKIKTSTYEGAILRHFKAYFSGESTDPDSGLSHLTHIRACCAVMLDAEKHGMLIDDRDRKVSFSEPQLQSSPD